MSKDIWDEESVEDLEQQLEAAEEALAKCKRYVKLLQSVIRDKRLAEMREEK